MAASKSQKIQAEIEKVKAKIAEQQARLKELEQKKHEAENSEIVDIVRGLSISLEELPLVLQRLRDGTSGQCVQKCRYRSVWLCSGRGRSAAWGKRSMTSL